MMNPGGSKLVPLRPYTVQGRSLADEDQADLLLSLILNSMSTAFFARPSKDLQLLLGIADS
jgi:hypothetical protein